MTVWVRVQRRWIQLHSCCGAVLVEWHKDRNDEVLTDFIPKTLGTRMQQALKAKVAETWGLALFLLLQSLRDRASPDRLHSCHVALMQPFAFYVPKHRLVFHFLEKSGFIRNPCE